VFAAVYNLKLHVSGASSGHASKFSSNHHVMFLYKYVNLRIS